MGALSKKKIIIGAVLFALVLVVVLQLSNIMTSAQPLTVEEATNKVQELYHGDIVNIKEVNGIYLIAIELDTGTYEIEIYRDSGEIGRVTRTEKTAAKEELQSDDSIAKEGEKAMDSGNKAEEPTAEQVRTISEKEAVAIALKEINGEVDDIDLESSGGIIYYLIEIERDEDDEEATVQVNAISGEVMSIMWDD
ncbi:PepSY domain-containing protein [Bacillus sp. B15-48]|uniref:PepSY domain-containing protein n=1 Tax=Bacillus sp. B15-48 TaxID=1548601 RepID=UPI00193FD491|nr:PepSY domain-containing protein [Bacillus sp. B15-48]MBM4760784.1 peptidase M4 [Bacillus sp. B15-48]